MGRDIHTNKVFVALCLFSTLLLLSGCDIPGHIELVNKTESKVVYRYYQVLDNSQIDTVNIELLSVSGQNKAEIIFSFGQQWSDKRIKEYLDSVISIELISAMDTTILNDKEKMFYFFKERRKGLFRQTIRIKFE